MRNIDLGKALNKYGLVTLVNIMVDEATRNYKLVVTLNNDYKALTQGRRDNPLGIPGKMRDAIYIPRYCVYNSKSQDWSLLQYMYQNTDSSSAGKATPLYFTPCKPISSSRQVFLVSQEQNDQVIHCYSSERNVWIQLRMSKILLALGVHIQIYGSSETLPGTMHDCRNGCAVKRTIRSGQENPTR